MQLKAPGKANKSTSEANKLYFLEMFFMRLKVPEKVCKITS